MRIKIIIIILFVFFWQVTFSQIAQWNTGGDENSITGYEVQQSKDTISWTTLALIPKGKSDYAYSLAAVLSNTYIRIKAIGVPSKIGVKNYYLKPILLKVSGSNSSTITNGRVSTSWWKDKLTWTSANEFNLNYYLIEKSTSTGYWSQVTQVKAKGTPIAIGTNYSYTTSRSWFSRRPSYRVSAVYFDGKKGVITIFN